MVIFSAPIKLIKHPTPSQLTFFLLQVSFFAIIAKLFVAFEKGNYILRLHHLN